MRLICYVILTLTMAGSAAMAQGVKDAANYGTVSNSRSTSTTSQASRPTAVRNVPTGAVPSGMGVQRVYKDGKTTTIVR